MVGRVRHGRRAIDGVHLAVFELRNALLRHLIPDVGIRLLCVGDRRENHLHLMLVLPRLNVFILRGRQRQVHHAHVLININLDVIIVDLAVALGVNMGVVDDLRNRRMTGFLRGRFHLDVVGFVDLADLCAAHSEPFQPFDLRRQLDILQIGRVAQGAAVVRFAQPRHQQRIQQQNHDNARSDDGAFVAAEAVQRIAE